jgi:hypothetical protein
MDNPSKPGLRSKMEKKTDCQQCRYYYITHDEDFPYGCKAMGFKSRRFPSIVVRNSSGQECLLIKIKQQPGERRYGKS